MASVNHKGRNNTPPFIKVTYNLFDSEAFRSLSGGAVHVLLLLIRNHNGVNNGEIVLSCRQIAGQTTMSKNTASKKLNELELKGFIQLMQKGQFTGRMASIYRLTFEDALPLKNSRRTDDWKRYCPKQNKVPDIELTVSTMCT